MKAKEEAGMLFREGQLESLLELQRNYVPCDGIHEWVYDEENKSEQHCAKCMVIRETEGESTNGRPT